MLSDDTVINEPEQERVGREVRVTEIAQKELETEQEKVQNVVIEGIAEEGMGNDEVTGEVECPMPNPTVTIPMKEEAKHHNPTPRVSVREGEREQVYYIDIDPRSHLEVADHPKHRWGNIQAVVYCTIL